jgi:hypothetical protein
MGPVHAQATPPRRRLAVLLAAVAAVWAGAAAAGIPVRASTGARVTADEPQYLLTALSLAQDRSLDVSDEIAEGAYLPFHEVPLLQQSRPLPGGRLVSPHDPLLPALLAAPTALWGWAGAKATLGLVAGVLGATLLWTAVRRFGAAPLPAALVVGLFGASPPLAVYGSQVYPELPAALAVATAVAAVTGPLRRGSLAALAGAVVALPWLSVKYAPVAAALAAVALVRLARSGRGRAAVGMLAFLGAAGVVFLAAHRAWYGGWTPYAVGSHFTGGELTVAGQDPDYLGRAIRLVALLTDHGFGLAGWQPAWLLAAPALGCLARRRPAGWAALMFPFAAGWLTATFVALTMHGWWWPGRQTVVVLPALVLAIAWWAGAPGAGATGAHLLVAVSLGCVGVVNHAWVVTDGLAGRINWVVLFQHTTSPAYRLARRLLPDYRNLGAGGWALHAAWTAALALGVVAGWRGARESPGTRRHDTVKPARIPSR